MPIPQESAAQLIDEINSMVQHGVDKVRLLRIRQEADKLEKIDFVSAKRVKGMVASLEFDRASVRAEFDAAIREGWTSTVYSDYSSALANMYDFVSAIEMMENSLKISPNNMALLQTALMLHTEAYDVDGSRSVISEIQKMVGFEREGLVQLDNRLMAIESILRAAGVTWQEVCERIQIASVPLIPYGLATIRQVSMVDEDGIFVQFILNGSPDKSSEAASRMLDAIAEVEFSAVDKVITFSCMSSPCQ
ncbi:MAG: hypothetical protein WC736_09840 [Gallionella sp.]|jgi:hypothetical protein